jgi:hypothetical protein
MPTPLARGAADIFLAEVKPNEWTCLIKKK